MVEKSALSCTMSCIILVIKVGSDQSPACIFAKSESDCAKCAGWSVPMQDTNFIRSINTYSWRGSWEECKYMVSKKNKKKNIAVLTIVMLNKIRCQIHFKLLANQIAWFKFFIQIHILSDEQCRFRSIGFFRNQLIRIYTVCKGRAYPGSAVLGLMWEMKMSDWSYMGWQT